MTEHHYAAVDLGSNSFHLLVAEWRDGRLEVVDRYKEMVQIARGLDGHGKLSKDTQTAALDVLARMGQRLRDIPAHHIRAVGTKTLRAARNSDKFLRKAQAALGHPIHIISGFEEARLVYQGVCSTLERNHQKRLVIDIGGASTEFIIGQGDTPRLLESLNLGCVVLAERFFKYGPVTERAMQSAYTAACAIIEPIARAYRAEGWDLAIGTSGTMRAAAELMDAKNKGLISRESLTRVVEQTIADGEVLHASVPKLRRDVLPAGLAIISAIFDQLKLTELHVADAALKEGLIQELLGQGAATDTRDTSVMHLAERYGCDLQQGQRVAGMASQLINQIPLPPVNGIPPAQFMHWAGILHEIGLHISHSGYHKHGHYLLKHHDMGGFSRFEQHWLASLVRMQRNNIKQALIIEQSQSLQPVLLCMVAVFRLALIFCRARKDPDIIPQLTLQSAGDLMQLRLILPDQWLDDHPLTALNLQQEADLLAEAGLTLTF